MLGRAFTSRLDPSLSGLNVITQFSILWIVFGAALDPKALRIFVAKLQMMRDATARPKAEVAGSSG